MPQGTLAQELAEGAIALQRTLLSEMTTHAARAGVSLAQYTLLGFLLEHRQLNMSQMAQLMGHTTPATTGLIDRLVQARLVERVDHPTDRRQVLVRISPRGREAVEEIQGGLTRRVLEVAGQLEEQEVQAWLRVCRLLAASGISDDATLVAAV